jgi:hypothetical protein
VYKVIKIYKSTATSFIDLLNLDTGTIDKVFDDSSVVSYDNFGFIEEGGIYDCKIELFGVFLNNNSDDSCVEITLIETNAIVGNTKYIKVLINSDVYYIPESETRDIKLKKKMYYNFTRKDLIQVDNVIHADCL